ncbi:MAG: transposase [Desulfobulbaceae bacterium]|nr:transposase [Desulfobulbaceae bacterium]
MPRTARLDAPGVFHHVTIRGIERRNIFRNKKDREDFLERLGKLLPETRTACYGWAFLSNHAHFLFRTGDIPLSNLMRRLLTGYVIGFNRRHGRHGQLFQNRFKSIVCQEDVYLKELVRYIHLNPVRTGLVPNLEKLDKYPYCGHSALMGGIEREWQQTDYVLTSFGKRVQVAREAYRGFMEEGLHQGRRGELVGGGLVRSLGGWSAVKKDQSHTMSDERILGDADFVDSILSQAGEALDRQYELKALGYDLHRVAERAAEIFNIDTDEIFSPGRQDRKVKARSLVCFWAARELGMSLSELARAFEMSVPGIGYAVERGKKLARSNKFKLKS